MKILDSVYKTLNDSKSKEGISFEDIFTSLPLDHEDGAVKNNLYTGIHFDHRFVMVGGSYWSLREFFTIEEVEALQASNMHQSEITE